MNKLGIYILLGISLLFVNCTNSQPISDELLKIIKTYIDKYPEIKNPCNERPYYKVHFKEESDTIGFWIAAYIGSPGHLRPQKPGEDINPNPIEIKGKAIVDGYFLFVYDYHNSKGYDLYTPLELEPYEIKILDISEECTNVWYPEALYYTISEDSIYITARRESFQLK